MTALRKTTAIQRETTVVPWERLAEIRTLGVVKSAASKGVWWWKVRILWMWHQVWRMINPVCTFI